MATSGTKSFAFNVGGATATPREVYGVVYKLTNTANGKIYIGQTKTRLSVRWSKHKQDARNGKSWPISAAIRKYGPNVFEREVLEKVHDRDALNEAEIRWIAELNPDYNCCAGGGGLGSPTDEVRAKISKSSKGRVFSEEHRARISEGQRGRKHSAETKAKIAEKQKAVQARIKVERDEKYGASIRPKKHKPYKSPYQDFYDAVGATTKIEKISANARLRSALGMGKLIGAANPMYGKAKPESIKAKLSDRFSGQGNPFFGATHSQETREKMRAAHSAREPVNCPYCDKVGHINAMKRWHFDNCRQKL